MSRFSFHIFCSCQRGVHNISSLPCFFINVKSVNNGFYTSSILVFVLVSVLNDTCLLVCSLKGSSLEYKLTILDTTNNKCGYCTFIYFQHDVSKHVYFSKRRTWMLHKSFSNPRSIRDFTYSINLGFFSFLLVAYFHVVVLSRNDHYIFTC